MKELAPHWRTAIWFANTFIIVVLLLTVRNLKQQNEVLREQLREFVRSQP